MIDAHFVYEIAKMYKIEKPYIAYIPFGKYIIMEEILEIQSVDFYNFNNRSLLSYLSQQMFLLMFPIINILYIILYIYRTIRIKRLFTISISSNESWEYILARYSAIARYVIFSRGGF